MNFREIRIGNKLALIMIALSLVVIAAVSSLFYIQFDAALKERVFLQLSSVKRLKESQVRDFLMLRVNQFQEAINNPEVQVESLDGFQAFEVFDQFPDKIEEYSLSDINPCMSGDVSIRDVTTSAPDETLTLALIVCSEERYYVGIVTVREIRNILEERTGLGLTGESFIVGSDYRMRTPSRFFPETPPTEIEVDTRASRAAFEQGAGEIINTDYRGEKVFSSFEPLDLMGLEWALLSEIDYQEALLPLTILRRNIIIALVIVLAIVFIASYQISKVIVKPIISMEHQLREMARGNIHPPVYNPERTDEIGEMFVAMDHLVEALEQTIDFAGKIGNGQFDADYKLLSEQDRLGKALLLMKTELKAYQESEQRLLKENQKSIIDGQELERSRLSKEMHDGLGPILTSIRLKLQSLSLGREDKQRMLELIDNTIQEVRRISNNLMPSVLVDFGAGEAIGNLIRQLQADSDISFKYKNDMTNASVVDEDIHIALYRISQEAINNSIKHADATEIKVSVSQFDDYIHLYISDNGKGFDAKKKYEGNGLRNIRERVKLLNGAFYIESESGQTTVEVEIPLV